MGDRAAYRDAVMGIGMVLGQIADMDRYIGYGADRGGVISHDWDR